MTKVSVSKGMVEQYTIRAERGWAVITVDLSGLLSIHSDYGKWSYWWGSPGMPFKEFLLSCDRSYLLGKLGTEVLDIDRVQESLRKKLKKALEDGEIEQYDHDDIDEWIESMDEDDYKAIPYQELLFDRVLGNDYCDIPSHMMVEPGLAAFYERIWPLFAAELRREVDTERALQEGKLT